MLQVDPSATVTDVLSAIDKGPAETPLKPAGISVLLEMVLGLKNTAPGAEDPANRFAITACRLVKAALNCPSVVPADIKFSIGGKYKAIFRS
jgi:hypothetical protein